MTRTYLTLAVPVCLFAIASCASTGDPQTIQNENKHLHTIVEEQEHKIDKLTADRATLDRRVQELEAKLVKMESTKKIVDDAKVEISEHVRQVVERFRGDSDIEVLPTGTGYRVVLREAVLFATASIDLSPEGRRTLQRVADTLKGGNEQLVIEGHTDDVPVGKQETKKRFPRGNIELSVGRAFAVWDYFTKEAGIETARISVAGHGPNRPRAPNTSDLNRHRNRRVEILVQEK
ncbi:MAG: OmpA/MotB family protein [Planctomycetota bacterium]